MFIVDDIFLQAAFAQPPRVMGLDLRPLSIAHTYTLINIGNPFGRKREEEPTRDEFLIAVFICSLTNRQIRQELFGNEGFLPDPIQAWARNSDWKDVDYQAGLAVFDQYLEDFTNIPDHYQDVDSSPKTYAAPAEWHLVATLVKMGIAATEEDAWNYPLSAAYCWRTIEAEKNGADSYVGPIDREAAKIVNEPPSHIQV